MWQVQLVAKLLSQTDFAKTPPSDCLYQWFSNWGPRSFWGPQDNFLGTVKQLSKNQQDAPEEKKFV